jgi:hypothetical protein
MIDSDNQLVAFERSKLRQWDFLQTPSMPSYRGALNTDELADVLAICHLLRCTPARTVYWHLA